MPKDKTVLIVEDDETTLELFQCIIRKEGFRIETASDGMKALEKIRRLRPDVAVMDLMLPGYGGLEMVYELSRGEMASIPLIIVTGRYISPADRIMMLRHPNVAGYFEKPVKSKLLTDALHKALGTISPEN